MAKKQIRLASPIVTQQIVRSVSNVLKSQRWTQGKEVDLVEGKLQRITGAKYVIATNSGTAALHTLLMSFNLKPTDEVITTPFTFAATVNTIILAGGRPILADISSKDFSVSISDIESKITRKTKVILSVDLYGQCADYRSLRKLADKHKLILLSDSAQSLGALHHRKPASDYADAVIYSTYATKNISSGEGGFIATNNKQIDRFARSFINQGTSSKKGKYFYDLVGLNYRMTDITAVMLHEQLKMFRVITAKRRAVASEYRKNLRRLSEIVLPSIDPNNTHVFHQYTILAKSKNVRDNLRDYLSQARIETGIYYPLPLHLSKHLRHLGHKKGDFKNSEHASDTVLSLPIHFYLSKADIKRISKEIISFFENMNP